MQNRLVVEIHNNTEIRTYHTILPLLHDGYCFSYEGDEDNVTPIGHKIAGLIVPIAGITELRLSKYDISVTKAIAFDWELIEQGIKQIFEDNTTPDIKIIIKDSRTPDRGGYTDHMDWAETLN